MNVGTQVRIVTSLGVAAVVAFAVQLLLQNRADVDLWGNVGFVRSLAWHAGFLRVNAFSFTDPAQPWINHEWLAQWLFNRIHTLFGNPGLLALKVALGLSTLALGSKVLRETCASQPVRFFLMLIVVSTMGYGFGVRPHLFTYLLIALTLSILLAARGGRPGLLVLLLPVALLWCNLHGAFFILPILLLLHILTGRPSPRHAPLRAGMSAEDPSLDARSRRLAIDPARQVDSRALSILVLAGVLLLTFVNPYGWRLWAFVIESAATPRRYLSEWDVLRPGRDWADHVDFAVLALLAVTAALLAWRRREPFRLAVLGCALVAAFALRRNIPLFALAVPFVAGAQWDAAFGPRVDALVARIPAFATALALAGFVTLSASFTFAVGKTAPWQIEIPPDRFPVEAFAFIEREDLRGNALVFFDWAEYAIWHRFPSLRVFMDGRFTDAYRAATVRDYVAFLYAQPGWPRALRAYPTDTLILHRGNPAAERMRADAEWSLVYEDRLAVIFLKRDVHADVIARQPARVTETPPASAWVFP